MFSELGKIWIVWDPSVRVSVLSKSFQMITTEVLFPNQSETFITSIVYASNDYELRKDLWNELSYLKSDLRILNKPWIVLGDFNQTPNPEEHSQR